MAKIRDTRHYTFLRTCSYKRIMGLLQDDQILQLEAIRNMQTETPRAAPQAVRWLTHVQRNINDIDLNFNTRLHGAFSKKIVDDFIQQTGCTDLWLESMSLLINNDDVRKAAAERLIQGGVAADSLMADEKYVAYFENTPCRRYSNEEKAPQWIAQVQGFRTEEEKQLGFEACVLDLVHVLPFDNWRDTQGKKRISRAHEREIERLQNLLNVHDDASFSRSKVVNALFPKTAGIVGSRQEVLTEKNVWVVVDFQ